MNSLSVLSTNERAPAILVRSQLHCQPRSESVFRSSVRSHRFQKPASDRTKKSVASDNLDNFIRKNMANVVVFVLNIIYFCLGTTIALPTLGHVERKRLETYEDLSDQSADLDFFSNLNFRFSCENRPIGLYADVDYDCRIFHACDEFGQGFPMICPNNTIFDQKQRICSDDDNDCENAQEWYYINELPYSDELTDDNKIESIEDDVPTVVPLAAV